MPVRNGDGNWDDDDFVVPPNEPSFADVGTNPGLGQSSTAPDADTEPHPVTDTTLSDTKEEDEEPLPEFDPKFRMDFEGLLYLGKLTKEFRWAGHKFVIRTLTTGELLEVGLVHARYAQSVADLKAYQAAVVAGCIVTVDDRPVALPITNEVDDTLLANKFNYIVRNWFPVVLDVVYEKFLELDARVIKVIEAMGKASG